MTSRRSFLQALGFGGGGALAAAALGKAGEAVSKSIEIGEPKEISELDDYVMSEYSDVTCFTMGPSFDLTEWPEDESE